MADRQRKKLGTIDRECEKCGHEGLTVLRSRAVRRGRDRLNPFFRARRKTYALCPDCRTRYPATGWSSTAVDRSGGRRPLVVLGWIAALLLGLVVLAEAVVLAVIASPVSTPLAVGVAAVVLVVLALVVWNARRSGAPARRTGGHRR